MKVQLEVSHRNKKTREVVIRSDTVIGRGADCNLRVSSGQVSRRHCKLIVGDGFVAVEDLGSSNGTLVKGVEIPSGDAVPLAPGARFEVGPVAFVVKYDPKRTPVASTVESDDFLKPGEKNLADTAMLEPLAQTPIGLPAAPLPEIEQVAPAESPTATASDGLTSVEPTPDPPATAMTSNDSNHTEGKPAESPPSLLRRVVGIFRRSPSQKPPAVASPQASAEPTQATSGGDVDTVFLPGGAPPKPQPDDTIAIPMEENPAADRSDDPDLQNFLNGFPSDS